MGTIVKQNVEDDVAYSDVKILVYSWVLKFELMLEIGTFKFVYGRRQRNT